MRSATRSASTSASWATASRSTTRGRSWREPPTRCASWRSSGPNALDGGAIRLSGERPARAADELLDRVRQVLAADVVVAALDADVVRLEQHVGVRVAERRLEAVRRQLDQQAERILEVDRVHEPAVLDAAVADAALLQALHRLEERGLRDREREVVHAARVRGRAGGVRHPVLVGEDGDQAAVARVEVQMALPRV